MARYTQNQTFTASSHNQTLSLGQKLGCTVKPGAVIALSGRLGAGKTTLVKGIAQALHIREPVTSPTYTIISEYEGSVPLYHVDLYRIKDSSELYDIGLEEYIFGKGITVIEWPDLGVELYPESLISISIQVREDGARIFTIQGITL
ncbi:MAG: tRNA (adenosine(37)-N6)-threonylcarbamoyltransferase complex ATPase subunit type 1 TsaE [Spirochaetales bacterium]|nr:tRNA (adenosine(37)-N6)-threonylcarbamoyltransferase complex ATPase subunit type 1 TsaE [Spirochaetales bacterium]